MNFSRSLLLSAKFLLQKCAILCNAVRTSLLLVGSEKPRCATSWKAPRKALFELQISCSNQLGYAGATHYESRFGEFIKSSPTIALHHGQALNSSQVISSLPILRARRCEDPRYGLCQLLSSSFLRCDSSSTQCASNNSIESLRLADSDWLILVGSDNARISSRICASRSGGSGGMLIYVIDAADLRLCLLLYFFAHKDEDPHHSRAPDHSTRVPLALKQMNKTDSLVRIAYYGQTIYA